MTRVLSALKVLLLCAPSIAASFLPAQNERTSRAEPVPVEESVMASRLSQQIQPVYPPLARAARVQGSVILTAHLGKDGSVLDTKLVRGHPHKR